MNTKSNNYGIVYLLTNPAMPGLVKIDMTTRECIEERMKELMAQVFRLHSTANMPAK